MAGDHAYGDMTPEGYQSGIVGTRLQKLVKGLDPEAARVEPHGLSVQVAQEPSGMWKAMWPDKEGRAPFVAYGKTREEALAQAPSPVLPQFEIWGA